MWYKEFSYLLVGVCSLFLFRFLWLFAIRKFPTFKNRVAQTARTRDFLLFICNLLLIGGAIYISLYALKIAAGGDAMTPAELSQLATDIDKLYALVWIFAGVAIGVFILFLIEVFRGKGEDQTSVEVPTPDPSNLENITKQIEGYRKLKTTLDEFFAKLNSESENDGKTKPE